MSDKGAQYLDVQYGSAGGAVGPKLLATVFVPFGVGVAFDDGAGNFWQLRLAQNDDGTLFVGDDGKPTIELVQVGV